MKARDRYGLRWLACAAALSACDSGDMTQGPATVDMRFRARVDVAVGASPKALAVGDVNENSGRGRARAPERSFLAAVLERPAVLSVQWRPTGGAARSETRTGKPVA